MQSSEPQRATHFLNLHIAQFLNPPEHEQQKETKWNVVCKIFEEEDKKEAKKNIYWKKRRKVDSLNTICV
jgi:hypothetical protein